MSWNIRAEMTEACSCNMLCPCWYGDKDLMIMDKGWCAGSFILRIEDGKIDDVDLGEFAVVVSLHFPGPTMFDAEGTGRLWMDERASNAQREALESVMQGQRGGPMEIVNSLVSNWLPTGVKPISISEEEGKLTAQIGDIGTIVSRRLKNEGGEALLMKNAPFVQAYQFDNQTAELAPSDGTRWNDPDMPEIFDCRSGVTGKIAWSGN